MPAKKRPPSDSIADLSQASQSSQGAEASTGSLDHQTYFEVIDHGIDGWLREEEKVRSTPAGSSDGLSDRQRRVLEVALRKISRAARERRRVCVTATTMNVELVMERLGMEKTRAAYIFSGWRKRLKARAIQPVATRQGEYVMGILIEGDAGRREIRAFVAPARPTGTTWKLRLVEPYPPVDEELESIAASERPPDGTSRTVASTIQTTFLVMRDHDEELARRFKKWCESERMRIVAWLRREVSRRRMKVLKGDVVIVEQAGGGTDGALALAATGVEKKKREKRATALGLNQSADVLERIGRTSLPDLLRRAEPGLNQSADVLDRIARTRGIPELDARDPEAPGGAASVKPSKNPEG